MSLLASVALTLKVSVTPSFTVRVDGTDRTGATFPPPTSMTVSVVTAVSVPPCPSLPVTVIVYVPEAVRLGVQTSMAGVFPGPGEKGPHWNPDPGQCGVIP